jgi:acyl-CoA thioesterase FadM
MKPPAHHDNKTKVTKAEEKPGLQFWFPTVVMNLEVKKALPQEGVEWLHVRITGKQIQHGRADMDFVVRDVEGEMVAQAQHVFMIVSAERNKKTRVKAAL